MKKWFFPSVFLFFCACSSNEDLVQKGEFQIRKMIQILREIDTVEALELKSPRLKKSFNDLATCLIEIKKSKLSLEVTYSSLSDELFMELARLYEMPGGKELIELSQLEAIDKLKKSL